MPKTLARAEELLMPDIKSSLSFTLEPRAGPRGGHSFWDWLKGLMQKTNHSGQNSGGFTWFYYIADLKYIYIYILRGLDHDNKYNKWLYGLVFTWGGKKSLAPKNRIVAGPNVWGLAPWSKPALVQATFCCSSRMLSVGAMWPGLMPSSPRRFSSSSSSRTLDDSWISPS